MHDLLFYLCYLKLYVHITIKNQNKGVVTFNISYNKFNAGPKHKIISYMSLILFITQSHSSMAYHQRIIVMSMSLKYGI